MLSCLKRDIQRKRSRKISEEGRGERRKLHKRKSKWRVGKKGIVGEEYNLKMVKLLEILYIVFLIMKFLVRQFSHFYKLSYFTTIFVHCV